jgi:hypothetical protein
MAQTLKGHLRPSTTRGSYVDVSLRAADDTFDHAVVVYGPRAASGTPTATDDLDTQYGGHWSDFVSGSFTDPTAAKSLTLRGLMPLVPSGSHCWILLAWDNIGDGTTVAAHVGPFNAA